MEARILIVDDEPAIVKLVGMNLQMEGFRVMSAFDGLEALKRVKDDRPDLVILDVMMPGMDGLEVCRSIRRTDAITPIMLLTVRDDEVDKVIGLEMGADDYMTKPFSTRELIARVKAMLRRSQALQADHAQDKVVARGPIRIDLEAHEVWRDGERIDLTPKEFDLLALLAQNPGKAYTRAQLLELVWGYEYLGDSRTVDVHISHLREKLSDDPSNPHMIETIRGCGYKFRA